jgi:hypothetical protein
MSFKDDLAAAKKLRPEPILVPVAVGESMYQVEVSRLPGTTWDAIMSRCPARSEQHFAVGYDTGKAAVVASTEHGRLLAADGEAVVDPDWDGLFEVISGIELRAIAAAWWGQNVNDPDQAVTALKKASAARESSSSN